MLSITDWIKKGLKTKNLNNMLTHKKKADNLSSRELEIDNIILELQKEKEEINIQKKKLMADAHAELDNIFVWSSSNSEVDLSSENEVISSEKVISEYIEKIPNNNEGSVNELMDENIVLENELEDSTKSNNDLEDLVVPKKLKLKNDPEVNINSLEENTTNDIKKSDLKPLISTPSNLTWIKKSKNNLKEEEILENIDKSETVQDLFRIPILNRDEKRKNLRSYLNN